MRVLKIILLIVFSLSWNLSIQGQENNTAPERTPELEAAKQTEKIQKELNLSEAQSKQVHEINLKYARERQISNSRTEALERIKNKDTDYKRVLKPEQYKQLKNKKYENSSYSSPDIKRTNPAPASSLRQTIQTPTYRTGGPLREQNTERGASTSTRQTETYNRDVRTNPTENSRNSNQSSETSRIGTSNTQTNQNTRSGSGSSNNSTSTNSRSTNTNTNTNTSRSSSGYSGGSRNAENSGNSSSSTNSSRSSSTSNTNRR